MRKGKREKREKNNKKEGEKIKIKKWLVKRNKQVKFLELKYIQKTKIAQKTSFY